MDLEDRFLPCHLYYLFDPVHQFHPCHHLLQENHLDQQDQEVLQDLVLHHVQLDLEDLFHQEHPSPLQGLEDPEVQDDLVDQLDQQCLLLHVPLVSQQGQVDLVGLPLLLDQRDPALLEGLSLQGNHEDLLVHLSQEYLEDLGHP